MNQTNNSNTNATVTVYMTLKVYKNKTSPVMLKLYSQGKAYTKKLFNIERKYWQKNKVKSTHNHAVKLNYIIRNEISRAQDYIFECKRKNEPFNFTEYLSDKKQDSLFGLLMARYENLTNNKQFRTARKTKTVANKVKDYDPKADANLSVEWLEGFKYFCINEYGNNLNTIGKDMGIIKTVSKADAFNEFKLPSEKSVKTKWTHEEIRTLYECEYPTHKMRVAVDCFVLSYFLWGMRVGDILTLKHEDIKNGQLEYKTDKTKKPISITLNETAKEIVSKYESKDQVIQYRRKQFSKDKETREKQIESTTSSINRHLKKASVICKVNKPISMHIARHSFAYTLDNKNLPIGFIQHVLGHSKPLTTSNYINSIKESDEINKTIDGLNLDF